ncbi:MAG: Yip1 family protein [Methylophilaceae bacterium]|nr:Yip1 family protein [Methylophilaceae bacterium]
MTLFKLFFKPTAGWESLMASQPSMHRLFLLHVLPFAMIPPVMIYFVGKSHTILFFDLLPGSKLILVSLILFFVQLVVVPVMASIIRQLAEIADSHPTYRESFILAAVAPTPLWMAPVFLVVPDIIVNIGVTSLAMMASAGFIYYGIPTVFKIKEQGHVHLLFGAVLMAGATAWGFLMISTFVIWGSVQNLQFAVGPAAG